ncbi:MAG TPA: tyrosine--tRNA ligase [Tepidisphaeraceae bacterium]|jgi:tyrosyl-tRNA synthetase|nr:tyrosine--tRNA ligase [Tepidisphaeraceae bacterium]
MQLTADLQSRGLLSQASSPDLDARLTQLAQKQTPVAYAGFDPTADSLHVGSLVPIIGLMHAQRNGIQPIAVVGGATGLIGDPSGKSAERQLLTKEKVAENVAGIRRVFAKFLDFNHPTAPALIVNNLDWFGPMSAIDFLRDVGKHFRVGPMLSKESVKARMESSDEGMSYTEFSYQLLQGYDFYRLYKDRRCVLQLGGSDQWGNITAGIDVIRKLEGESGHAFGLTMPLITTSSGAKFGKSEGNAVWLTDDRTTPFDFYQFWLRTEDADVAKYLAMFTFLPMTEVNAIVADHQKSPDQRLAQKRLAAEITTLVHGKETLEKVISASQTLYSSPSTELDASAIEALITQGVPSITVDRAKLDAGYLVIDACIDTGLAKTKSDARRLMQQGGLSLNNTPVSDPASTITPASLIANRAAVLRSGKRNYRLIESQ